MNTTSLPNIDGRVAKVLIADDEKMLADLLAQALQAAGWEAYTANDGFEALQKVRKIKPDVVILDVMMPGLDGLETLSRLRRDYPDLPVLMLTAKDTVQDRVLGLRSGADDYVTKPFELEEVCARLEVLIRRQGFGQSKVEEDILVVHDLEMNISRHELKRGENPISLTKTEYELCKYLMENAGIVVSKSQILDAVWHFDFGGKDSVVELYISYLRKKIDIYQPSLIHTVRGIGYVLKVPDQE